MTFPVLLITLLGSAWALGIARKRSPQHKRAISRYESLRSGYTWQFARTEMPNPHLLQVTKAKFQESLELGQIDWLAHRLEAGPEFAVQVRALAEIGTPAAAEVLEKQIDRNLGDNPHEECWYSIDLSHSLRSMNRCEVLPQLLLRSKELLPLPMGHLYAAELVAFPNFAEHLDYPLASIGQASLRVLHQVLRGIRCGQLPMQLFVDANVNESINRLVRACPGSADPLVTLVFLELLRLRRRSLELIAHDSGLRWRISCLQDVEPIVREYLHGIGDDLLRSFDYISMNEEQEYLRALDELRTDCGSRLLSRLMAGSEEHRLELFRCLRWSKYPGTIEFLVKTCRELQSKCTPAWWKRWDRDRESSSSWFTEQMVILEALSNHPSEAAEKLLLETASAGPRELRHQALKSLGWWEPINRGEVLNCLHIARLDTDGEIRIAATMALARLGEVAALQQIRESLTSSSSERVHESIEWIAEAGLSWLWCELDELTEGSDSSVAIHAGDALERLRERLFGPLG
jgi:hypothetical protein